MVSSRKGKSLLIVMTMLMMIVMMIEMMIVEALRTGFARI